MDLNKSVVMPCNHILACIPWAELAGVAQEVPSRVLQTGDLPRIESQREETILLRPLVEGRVVVEKVAAVAVSSMWSRHLGVRSVVRIKSVLLG